MKVFRFSFAATDEPLNIDQMRQRALARLPSMVRAYLEGGAEDAVTLACNVASFRKWRLRQRTLAGVSQPNLATTMFGEPVSMPLALSPTGANGLFHRHGDLASFRAAEAVGTRATLSTAATHSLEEVASATEQRHWFQLYPSGNREMVGNLIDRAQTAGYGALVVTTDLPVGGNREDERRSGMGLPMRLTPGRCLNLASHPRWLWNVARHGRFLPVHMLASGRPSVAANSNALRSSRLLAEIADEQYRNMQSDLNWQDLAWIRERWQGRLYVKGVLDADDAERLAGLGWVDGIIVSNHGGRQLDRALSSLDALARISARVGDRTELYLDGGIRRGADIAIALSLGARGVFIGRPFLYGLAVGGEAGVGMVLKIFAEELRRVLVLMGCESVTTLDRDWLEAPDQAGA